MDLEQRRRFPAVEAINIASPPGVPASSLSFRTTSSEFRTPPYWEERIHVTTLPLKLRVIVDLLTFQRLLKGLGLSPQNPVAISGVSKLDFLSLKDPSVTLILESGGHELFGSVALGSETLLTFEVKTYPEN
jgi:hypothetical protein